MYKTSSITKVYKDPKGFMRTNRGQAIHELEEARHATVDRRSFERYQVLLLWWKGCSLSVIGENHRTLNVDHS